MWAAMRHCLSTSASVALRSISKPKAWSRPGEVEQERHHARYRPQLPTPQRVQLAATVGGNGIMVPRILRE
jgi:hypothetical protein